MNFEKKKGETWGWIVARDKLLKTLGYFSPREPRRSE